MSEDSAEASHPSPRGNKSGLWRAPGACVPVEGAAVEEPAVRRREQVSEEVVGAQTKLCVVNLCFSPCPPDARPRRRSGGGERKTEPSGGVLRCHQTTLRVTELSREPMAHLRPHGLPVPEEPRPVGFHMWDKGRGLGQSRRLDQFFLGLLPHMWWGLVRQCV